MKHHKFVSGYCAFVAVTMLLAGQSGAREIGGYVDRADDRFVRNVFNFLKEFSTSQGVGSQSWKYSQYYYNEPYMFTNSNNSYADAVDFIYTSGHGNSYYLQTNASTASGINFAGDMSSTNGLGDFNAEYLVIESCLTVVSTAEVSDPWSPWMNTLKGLHQIVGFHTVSYSDNGIPNNYARKLKSGGGVWQSWFAAVNEERSWWRGTFYPGMASAIYYDGTQYDTLATQGYPDPYQWGGWHQGKDWGRIWNVYQHE